MMLPTTGTTVSRRGGRYVAWVIALATIIVGCVTATSISWAYWTANSLPGASGASTATTVGAGKTPTVTGAGNSMAVVWPASTLANGVAVTGYLVKRYNADTLAEQTILPGCAGTILVTTCTENAVPVGRWAYSVTPVFAQNWRGAESPRSAVVVSDTTPPASTITTSVVSGSALQRGNSLFYRGSTAGSVTLRNAVSDSGSGPASSSTSALAGTSTGWTHTPSTVSTPSGGPYVSSAFTWSAGTTSSPSETVTARDVAGNTTATTLNFINDSTGPVGTISYLDGFQPGKSVTVTFSISDAGAGADFSQLQRASAPYAGGACGTFGQFGNIEAQNPSSPYKDIAVANSTCYRYQLVGSDLLGNPGLVTSANTAIVDYAGAVFSTPGAVSQWRLGDAAGLGSRTTDSKGANTGDYVNGPVLGTTGTLPNDVNTAVTFDGVNDYAAVGTAATPVGAAPRSVELWFQTTSTARQVLFTYGSKSPNAEFGLWLNAGGASLTAWGYGAGSDKTFNLPTPVNDGTWHHLVKTYNGTSITLFIDGVGLPSQVATRATVVDAYAFGIGAVLTPGDANSGGYFRGALDEVSLYSVALSQVDVANHFELGRSLGGDTTGPAGGSVTATGLVGTGSRYSTSTTINLTLAKGTDGSGIATSGARLLRSTATLSSSGGDGVCGPFGAFVLTTGGSDPSSPKADAVTDQACYSYQYQVSDTLGNYTTYSSAIVKVDTTPPTTPVVAFSGLSNTYWNGATLFYRSTAATGGFTVAAGSSDPGSGVLGYVFPALGTGWTSTPGALGVNTYSWASTPAGSGTKEITATNHAGSSSLPAPFALTNDSTAPAAGSLNYANGTSPGTTLSVGFDPGTDAGSGIQTVLLQRASALRIGTTCGIFGAFATRANGTNPSSPVADPVAAGNCYKYQLVVSDRVGNTQTITSSSVASVYAAPYFSAVNSTPGLLSYWRLGDSGTSALDSRTPPNNAGTYTGGPLTQQPGALTDDTNTAVAFDGVNDSAIVTRQIADDFSIEFWFKTTSGIGAGTAWNTGAGLVDADVAGVANDFGLSVRMDGRILAGVGGPDTTIMTPFGFNDGAWHHVVMTRQKTSGAIVLYVDGVQRGSATGSVASLSAPANLHFGKIASGTNFFAGTLDEIAVYTSTLSAATVAAHYNAR